jgi:tRNA (guanine-N(7)-)-methyltransferase
VSRHRDIPGALGGSRILAHPEVAAVVATLHAKLLEGRPTLVEVGFDHGRRLSSTAAANPDWTVIGLEVRKRRVAEMHAWADREALANLHAFRLDARAIFANALLPARIDIVEVLFPTPWPEGKARKRLLLTPDFLADAAEALRPGGLLYVATDVAWYADLITSASAAVSTDVLAQVSVDTALERRPPCPQQSRREWVCERDGLPVYRFAWERPTTQ